MHLKVFTHTLFSLPQATVSVGNKVMSCVTKWQQVGSCLQHNPCYLSLNQPDHCHYKVLMTGLGGFEDTTGIHSSYRAT